MKNIVVGFSHPTKFSLHAWLIEKIDNSPFDHAYLKFYSSTLDRNIIYQSNWRGVEFIGATLFNTSTTPVYEYSIAIDDESYNSMLQFCVDNAGISYSYLGVLGSGLVKLGICKKNPFDDGLKTEFCSEIISRCLNIVDPTKFKLDANNISPKDLNDVLIKLQVSKLEVR
jgi:hypothetical protein